jgi:thiamine-monophosphate kinase
MKPNEFGLIAKIRRIAGGAAPPVVLGIGDDCAAVEEALPGRLSLQTIDSFVEGVHFRRIGRSPHDIGWKAVAVNLSDIAAMGGEPAGFMLSLMLPQGEDPAFIVNIVRGAVECGRRHGAPLVGGNISATPGPLAMDVSMSGSARRGKMLLRSKAKVGDVVFVSGFPGCSQAGLEALESGDWKKGAYSVLVRRHLRPEPMLKLGSLLASRRFAAAAIDTSDGLVQDSGHICEESEVGAEIDPGALPVAPALARYCRERGFDPLRYALTGGEDYGLLFTARERHAAAIVKAAAGIRVTAIGRIVRGSRVKVLGRPELQAGGWDHLSAFS